MPSKLQYPIVVILISDNLYKHGYILDIYINTTFVFIADKYKPLIKTFKAFFQAILTFIIKTKQEPNN